MSINIRTYVAALLVATLVVGCATQTPSGQIRCYTAPCVSKARRDMASHQFLKQKEQEREQARRESKGKERLRKKEELEKRLTKNPWMKLAESEIRKMAEEHNVQPLYISSREDGTRSFVGIDRSRIKLARSVFGNVSAIGYYTTRPDGEDRSWMHPGYIVDCEAALIQVPSQPPRKLGSNELDVITYLTLCNAVGYRDERL